MKHPNGETLEKYAAREISAAEMTGIILHLENCAECFDVVQNLSGSVADAGVLLFSEIETEVFHLDYDEHLQPFVDNEADGTTREIVESHTQVCPNCAFELRELREFANNLRLKEIEKGKQPLLVFKLAWRVLSSLWRYPAFSIAAVILLLSGLIWLKVGLNKPDNKSEFSKASDIAEKSDISQFPEVVPVDKESKVKKADTNDAQDQLPQISTVQPEKANSKANPAESNEVERAYNLPVLIAPFRKIIISAIAAGKLTVPKKLDEITKIIKSRGDSSENMVRISPDREILKETKPKFSWNAGDVKNRFFIIEIYDESNNSIAVSPPLKNKNWTPKKPLDTGKNYQWELRVVESDKTSPKTIGIGIFHILDRDGQTKLRNLKFATPLQRGIIFASLGLIKDARREFVKASLNSPESPARKFLRQLAEYPQM